MKKLTLALIIPLLLVCGNSRADVVSQEKARKIAENFLGASPTRSSGGLTLLWDGLDATTRAGGEAAPLYIYNRDGGGWVMVCGDECFDPILGYSYHDRFEVEDMPENLKEFMDLLIQDIINGRRMGRKSSSAAWNQALIPTRAGDTIPTGRLLRTAKYNQGNPWNLKCPMIDGKHALAGCCAIAQAIIMQYHRYPEKGQGQVGGYSGSKYTAELVTLGHKYDWDNMLYEYKSGQYSAVEADAVATLVRDIGYMGRSSYGLSGTGSTMSAMTNRARDYFKYNPYQHRVVHSIYTDEAWFKLIKDQIDNYGPMNYASDTHSYVCDGYDSRGYVHFNYGWGGSSNGYYNIAGKTAYGACVDQVPAPKAKYKTPLVFLAPGTGITKAESRQIVKGTAFKLKVGDIENFSFDDYSFEWILAHVDRNDNVKEYISATNKVTLAYSKTTSATVSCTINEDIVLGDKVKLYYRDAGSKNDWTPAEFNRYTSGFTGELLLTSDPIENLTSLSYDRSLKRFVINTDKNAIFRLLDGNGNSIAEAIEGRYGVIYVHAGKLTPGEYILELSSKYYIDVKQIKLKVQ